MSSMGTSLLPTSSIPSGSSIELSSMNMGRDSSSTDNASLRPVVDGIPLNFVPSQESHPIERIITQVSVSANPKITKVNELNPINNGHQSPAVIDESKQGEEIELASRSVAIPNQSGHVVVPIKDDRELYTGNQIVGSDMSRKEYDAILREDFYRRHPDLRRCWGVQEDINKTIKTIFRTIIVLGVCYAIYRLIRWNDSGY